MAACSSAEVALGLPTELLDGTYATLVVLLQSGEAPSSAVVAAEVFDLPLERAWHHPLGERDVARLLAYEVRPEAPPLTEGPLRPASSGTGQPFPAPDRAFATTALGEGSASWTPTPDIDTNLIPWRIPDEISNETCAGAQAETWRLLDLANTRPRALLSRGVDEVFLVGQTNEADGRNAKASLFVAIRNIDDNPLVESLAPPLEAQSYRDAIWADDELIIASTDRGWLTRVDLRTREVLTLPALGGDGQWMLQRGDDGSILAFDAQDEPLDDPRGTAAWIDPLTLEANELEAPEPIVRAAVMHREFLIAAGERNLYRYEAGAWEMEQATPVVVTNLVRGTGRIVAILNGTQVLERDTNGRWTDLLLERPFVNMLLGTFMNEDRLILGGGHGLMLQHHAGKWCGLPPGVSREVFALGALDASSVIATYYSELDSEPLSFTRVSVQAGP